MKRTSTRIISAALAATLLTATAASAAPGNQAYRPVAQTHNNNAAALGFGLFALGLLAVVAASNNQHNDRDRYYAPPPPRRLPPPRYNDRYYGPPAHYYDGRYNDGDYDRDYDRRDGYGYRR